MAENENNTPLVGGDSENFMRLMSRALARIEKVDKATVKANQSLQEYAKTFEELNEKLEDYVGVSEKVKPLKSSGSTKSGSARRKGNTEGQRGQRGQSKKNGKFDEIERLFGTTVKFSRDIRKANISATATSAMKAYTTLGAKMAVATGAVGLMAAGIGVLSKATLEAHKNTVDYTKSLLQMGVQLNRLEKSSITTANEMNKLGNRWENTVQSLGESFKPVLDLFIEFGNFLLGWADDSESKKKKYGTQADIVSGAKQSGFSADSARALAGGTYEQALVLGKKYGQQASDVAKKLADAWMTGSDAAKEYGVVVNDNVLTGYMASKGVDIANVEITDAMKKYYRYQLLMEQAQASNSDTMQDMIKQWTQLGFVIDKTKGKLFSFDEVIQLAAIDPNIPEVEGSLSGIEEEEPGKNPGIIPGTANTSAIDNNTSAVEELAQAVRENTSAVENRPGVEIPDTASLVQQNVAVAEKNEQIAQQNAIVAQQNQQSAQVVYQAAQVSTVAALTNSQASQTMMSAVNNIYAQMVAGAQQVGSVIASAVQGAVNSINTATRTGVNTVSSTANQQVNKIINIAEAQKNSINQTAQQGKIAVGQTAISGVNLVNRTSQSNISRINRVGQNNIIQLNRVGQHNINSVNQAGQSNVSTENHVGQSWVSAIQSAGSQMLSALSSAASGMAGRIGLGMHMNYATSIASGARAGAKSGGVRGAVKGGLSGVASGAKTNVSALINSPLDLITETGDLIQSLKDDGGTYRWSKLPKGVLNMAVNSITNPLMAIGNWGKLGYQQSRDAGHGVILSGLSGLVGGITGGAGYTVAEFLGDIGATAEVLGDAARLNTSGLSGFNNEMNKFLYDWVSGYNWQRKDQDKAPESWIYKEMQNMWASGGYADGGIGTKEVHNATLFENNKKEAVIPLETSAGIKYLSDALQEAGLSDSSGGDITINLTLSGVNIADNNAEWERVGKKIAEVIEVQRQRRGELNYGSTF